MSLDSKPKLNPEQLTWVRELLAIYEPLTKRYKEGERFPHQIPQRVRMVRIEKALQSILDGEAVRGICISCEAPIPEGRLKALPESVWCVSCSEGHELKQHSLKGYPHHRRLDVPRVLR